MKQQWKFRGPVHFRWHSAIGTLHYKLGSSTFRCETNRTGSVSPFGVHGSLGLGGPVGNLALPASFNNVMYFICRCCDGLSYAPQTHLSLDSASAVALRCDGDVQHLIIHDWAVGEKRPWKSYPRPSLSFLCLKWNKGNTFLWLDIYNPQHMYLRVPPILPAHE